MNAPIVPWDPLIAQYTMLCYCTSAGLVSSLWHSWWCYRMWLRLGSINILLVRLNVPLIKVDRILYCNINIGWIARAFFFFRLIRVYIRSLDLQHCHITSFDLYMSELLINYAKFKFIEKTVRFKDSWLSHKEKCAVIVFWFLKLCLRVLLNMINESGTNSLPSNFFSCFNDL